MKYLAGIDVGTTGVKCIVIDDNGMLLSSCTENYPCYTPKPGWSEQTPEDWWQASKKAMLQAVKESGVDRNDITALGFSGQMHGLVALDDKDQVIRPAILWNDQRTDQECKEVISNAGGLDQLLDHTNNTMLTGYTGGKILWLKNHEPENFGSPVKKRQMFRMPQAQDCSM
jgi:xylulokinase